MTNRSIVQTTQAPEAIGTYSQAVKVGDTVYLSGQIPLVPESMSLIEGGIEEQVDQVFKNLSAVCEAAGSSLQDIVKLNIYLTDLQHFSIVNEIMAKYFSQPYPARAAIGVAALPRNAQVEMDGILVIQ